MDNFKPITEKTYPIERKWVIKNVIIWSPVLTSFIASLFSGGEHNFKLKIFIIVFIIGLIIIPFILYLYLILTIKNYHYEFGEKLINLKQGIIEKSERHFPYGRIQNINLSQSLINKLLGLASISIETASEGGGAKFIIKKNKKSQTVLSGTPLGFFSNKIGIPGLSYENALKLKDAVKELMRLNPIDDAQSGL